MEKYKKILFIVAVICLIVSIGYGFYDLYQRNLRYKFFITHRDRIYKTEKIDSISNGTIYFKDRDKVNVSITGEYVIREVNR